MTEIVTIQLGRCGNATGFEFLKRLCDEHGINAQGGYDGDSCLDLEKIYSYFYDASSGRYLPRFVMVDLDSSTMDEICGEKYGCLYNGDNIIYGDHSASNNWAKGHYTEGAELIDAAMDSIRKQAEACDSLQGFHLLHSLGGGTGSGMGSLISQKIKEEYPDRMLNNFCIFPSSNVSNVVVEPYNCILACHNLIEYSDCVIVLDNEKLYDIMTNKFQLSTPTYNDLNHIIGSSLSYLTSTFRFDNYLNQTMRKFNINLIPFQRNKFLLTSMYPITSRGSCQYYHPNIVKLHHEMYNYSNFLCATDPRHGRYLTFCAVLRGRNNHGITDWKQFSEQMLNVCNKNSSYWVEWIPNNIKFTICDKPIRGFRQSIMSVGNSTAIQDIFKTNMKKFSAMYKRKAFMRFYIAEGMDELEFEEAKQNVTDLVDEYDMYQNCTADEDEFEDDSEDFFESLI